MAGKKRFVNMGLLFAVFCIAFASLNMYRGIATSTTSDSATIKKLSQFGEGQSKKQVRSQQKLNQQRLDQQRLAVPTQNHTLAGLSCDRYGGPSDEIAAEMVYWEDHPSDATYVSPFKRAKGGVTKYMTFEPDAGGWNNIRMAMEVVVALAHAMGRTLVLPPSQQMYLISKGGKDFSFADFFHMEKVAAEHDGLDIISMQEFLEREAMTGHMIDQKSKKVSFPPGNRTSWDGRDWAALKSWLRRVALVPQWKPLECLAAFPSTADPGEEKKLLQIKEEVLKNAPYDDRLFLGKPTRVDASPVDRMKEVITRRKELCIYNQIMQASHVVHFHNSQKEGFRFLIHFYAYLFFEDWRQDLWTKRFIRDHVRYIDELQCAAARVVHAIREHARERDPSNTEGAYDSFHIRRGDFQYKNTRVGADKIYEDSKDQLTEGATVYIATDERDKSFFKPLKEHYDILFLDDFMHLIPDLNKNYYGMLDQLIASKGRIFFGCWFSTFTGYINRLRGYHTVKQQSEGEMDGVIESYYYALKEKKDQMRKYYAVRGPYFSREFPASWRDLNKGIGELV